MGCLRKGDFILWTLDAPGPFGVSWAGGKIIELALARHGQGIAPFVVAAEGVLLQARSNQCIFRLNQMNTVVPAEKILRRIPFRTEGDLVHLVVPHLFPDVM